MNLKYISTATLLALLFISLPGVAEARAQAQPDPMPVTLEDALMLARDNSQRIRQANLDLERSSLTLRESQFGRLPTVSIDGQYTNNLQTPVIFLPEGSPFGDVLRTGAQHNFNANATLAMPVYSAQLNRSIDLARAAQNLNQAILNVTERQVEVEVQRAFLNGLITRRALSVLEESQEMRERNLELVRSLYAEGVAPEYDLIRTEVQVDNMQPDVVRARNDHQGALNYVKLLTGISMDVEIVLNATLSDFYGRLPEIVFDQNFEMNADVIQLNAQRRITEEQLRIEEAAYLPSLSAFGNYTYQAQGQDLDVFDYNWVNSSAVGLRLSIPLFDATRHLRIQQAQVDIDQVDVQREFLLESLESQFQTTARHIEQVEATIAAQQRTVAQAERGLNIARVSYENGVHSVVEVNDAELALTQARLNHANALYDYINAVLDMEDLLGRSLEN